MWNTSQKNLLQNYNKKCTYASKVSKKNVFTLQYAYKRVIDIVDIIHTYPQRVVTEW
jgi:hypothetical protein